MNQSKKRVLLQKQLKRSPPNQTSTDSPIEQLTNYLPVHNESELTNATQDS
jgi:hypothetical protein